MAFNQYYDCSNILEVITFLMVLLSAGAHILFAFKPDLQERVAMGN